MLDRRALLKIIGSVGATATVSSACSAPLVGSVSAQGLTGGKFDKTVPLATAGPGGNPAWQPGDAVKFLPPLEIPTRGAAADTLAALPKDHLLRMYELMVTSRRWETAMKDLFLAASDNLYGAFHTYVGEEAVAVGVIGALNEDDYIASTHRGHGHLIAKGGDLDKMSAEIFFKATGYNKGYGGSMHITDMSRGIMGMNGIVGASYYMAAGAALRAMVRGTKQVAVAFYGDGAAASPYYFSAVRSAANQRVPVLFVNENNFQYMGVPMARTVPTKYVSELTKGLDIPHHVVDGNDLAAVHQVTREAVTWARDGKGPSVIEAMTYRWYDHSGFAGGRVAQEGAMGLPYRTDDEVRQWISRDPILRYRTWLTAKGLASDADLAPIEAKVQAAVDRSIEFARSSPDPRPEDGVFNTYADVAVAATQFYDRRGLSGGLT
jgi:TPP-dependent pyruvate/acetoin dehydrogenase alpha subunit